MSDLNKELAARVAALEFLLIQTLFVAANQIKDLDVDAFISALRASFDERSVRLDDEAGQIALETFDRMLSSVERTLKDRPSAHE